MIYDINISLMTGWGINIGLFTTDSHSNSRILLLILNADKQRIGSLIKWHIRSPCFMQTVYTWKYVQPFFKFRINRQL